MRVIYAITLVPFLSAFVNEGTKAEKVEGTEVSESVIQSTRDYSQYSG